jgi:hypothetical protein
VIDKFARAFVRNPLDGSWFCREAVHIVGPNGPMTVTPGVTYRKGKPAQGYDVAQWLDDWHERQLQPAGVEFF